MSFVHSTPHFNGCSILDGIPYTVLVESRPFFTILPADIILLSAIVTPFKIIQLQPIHTCLPILIGLWTVNDFVFYIFYWMIICIQQRNIPREHAIIINFDVMFATDS